jgi:hypothetical protein
VIGPLPPTFAETRDALHRLAVYVISPAQRLATGSEIVLRPVPGGFGTPAFGKDARVVRVDGTDLVDESRRHERREPITSLAAAARLCGIEPDVAQEDSFDVPPHGDLDAPLPVDPAGARALADWYALAGDVLDELRREARPEDGATPGVRLWPEHFDAAIDLGDEAAGLRGGYGASPGDGNGAEPYLYATVWAGPPDDPFWNAKGFGGAWMRHSELLASGDPRAAALGFFREARRRVLGY